MALGERFSGMPGSRGIDQVQRRVHFIGAIDGDIDVAWNAAGQHRNAEFARFRPGRAGRDTILRKKSSASTTLVTGLNSGKRGAFWGGLWDLFLGGLFMTIPVVGHVVYTPVRLCIA
jgi:hypothetical protein